MSIQTSEGRFSSNVVPFCMLALGITLLYIGAEEYKLFEESLADYVRATPDTSTIWIMIIGIAATIGGAIGLLRDKVV